jgi:hypothetical protein
VSFRSRAASLLAIVLIALAVPLSLAPSASAANVGYIRLAHLSPDTPKVDVWLTSFRDKKFSEVVRSVPYGTLSPFQRLQPGTYNVSMRSPGAAADSKPLLTTNLRVKPGGAYTVAGVGRRANITLKVLNDDLSAPAPGTARLRLVQASSAAKVVDVTTSTGRSLVTDAAFPSATSYVSIPAQRWTLTVGPKQGGALSATRTVDLKAGAIYTLLLLDKKLDDVQLVVRTDSAGTPNTPVGSVAAGLGGAAPSQPGSSPVRPLAAVVAVLLLGIAMYVGRPARPRGAHRAA